MGGPPIQTAAPAPARAALTVWAAVIGALAIAQLVARAVPAVSGAVGALAVALFLWAPSRDLARRGQDAHDAGWRFDRLGRDLAWGVGVSAVVLPLFTVAFVAFVQVLPDLPADVQRLLAPYSGRPGALRFRWPASGEALDLVGRVLGNLAIAASEEYFYRGYVTMRLEERWPPRTRILGAPLGRAAVLAAALFAVGHLLEPAPWRVAVFVPALLFAWLRARTGTVVAAAVCHFFSNVWLMGLERAAYG